MSTLKAGKDLIDLFYPVGTYYETSDTSFDPNKIWGGTWIQDTKGRVMVGKADSGVFEEMNGNYGDAQIDLTHYHTPGGLLTACIGSPAGNAHAIGFAACDASGNGSTYSVGNSGTCYTNGHPNRSHNTLLTGRTEDALGKVCNIQPSRVCIR